MRCQRVMSHGDVDNNESDRRPLLRSVALIYVKIDTDSLPLTEMYLRSDIRIPSRRVIRSPSQLASLFQRRLHRSVAGDRNCDVFS